MQTINIVSYTQIIFGPILRHVTPKTKVHIHLECGSLLEYISRYIYVELLVYKIKLGLQYQTCMYSEYIYP